MAWYVWGGRELPDRPQRDIPGVTVDSVVGASVIDDANPLFLVLEGGGAKGIAHVAAWAALKEFLQGANRAALADPKLAEHCFVIKQVAGTSAGAIAAALIAAGADANDIIDDQGRMPLSGPLGISRFYDLFGISGWRRLKLWRSILRPSNTFADLSSRLIGDKATGLTQRERQKAECRGAVSNVWNSIGRKFDCMALRMFWVADAIFRSIPLMLIIIFICLLLGTTITHIITRRPNEMVTDFYVFAALWYLTARAFSWVTKNIEWKATKIRRRHVSTWLTALLHPVVPAIMALVFTVLLRDLSNFPAWIDRFLAEANAGIAASPGFFSWPLKGWSIAFCVFVVFWWLEKLVRSFLKGQVSTVSLRKDLDLALRTIVTQRPVPEGDVYRWEDREAPDEARQQLFERLRDDPAREVTFADLAVAVPGCKLSIVTADVINNVVHVYSTDTHPDTAVAEAVAASAAIPLAFNPLRTGGRILVDGGIVSSIPAWIFRQHRNLNPDAHVLAVAIAAEDLDEWLPAFLKARADRASAWGRFRGIRKAGTLWSDLHASLFWPLRLTANIVYTAMFGARPLELDASDRLDVVTLEPTFGLMDFDKGQAEVEREKGRLREDARIQIEDLYRNKRQAFHEIADQIRIDLETLANRARRARGLQPQQHPAGHIRIFLAEPETRTRALRIKRSYHFHEDDRDDRLLLPFNSSLAGFAAERSTAYLVADRQVLGAFFRGRHNRYRRLVKNRRIEWCWAIPIQTQGGALEGVLVIESDCAFDVLGDTLVAQARERTDEWPVVELHLSDQAPLRRVRIPDSGALVAIEFRWSQLVANKYYVAHRRPRARAR